jgi:hypothetical protein
VDRSKFDEMMAKSAQKPEPTQAVTIEDGPGFQPSMQYGFDVVEVQRVNLQAGDVLMVTVKNDDLSQESVDMLRKQLQLVFPDNKVFVFAMGTSDDVQLSVVSQSQNPVAECSPVGYCNDCDCGKKAQATETDDEHMKNLAKQASGGSNE